MALESLYTKRELAHALKVSVKTIDRWVASKKISAGHKINKRTMRWFESEVQMFVAQLRMGQFDKDEE